MSSLVRSLIKTTPKWQSPLLWQKANFVAGPPQYPLPFTKKIIYGTTVVALIWGQGLYMMSNYKNYYEGDPVLGAIDS